MSVTAGATVTNARCSPCTSSPILVRTTPSRPFAELRFSYPDGPHDTEAMLVDGDGRFTFVTKGPDGGVIFQAPATVSSSEPNPLTEVGEAPQYVTDGTVLADGRMILKSYVAVFQVDPATHEIVASAATPPLKQGESVTEPLAGRGLLIGTEGQDSEVLRVPVPTELGRVPTITPSASAPASPSTNPSGASTAQPQAGENGNQQLLLFGGAGLVLIAGAGVAVAVRFRGRKT